MASAARSLSEILGQPKAVGILRAAIASGRVHHAWVFVGPMGVGKLTTALAFAGAILDPTTAPDLSGTPEPDPSSPTQRLLASGTHPDLHVITKELARYSDDKEVRSRKLLTIPKQVIDEHLLTPIALTPTLRAGGLASKVFIVDEAERLDRSRSNAPTQNSMLKTLEEPPDGSVIILVTSAEEALLPTIRSRCQRVVFSSLDERSMRSWLDASEIRASPEEARWLVRFADGSPGRLALAHEGGMYEWGRAIDPMLDEVDRGRFPPELGATMAKLVDEWAAGVVKKSPQASKEAANLAGARAMLTLLLERCRASLRAAAAVGGDPSRALHAIECVERAEQHIAANVTLRNAMENLAVQWSSGGDGPG